MNWKEEFQRLLLDEQKIQEATELYETNRPETIFRYRKGNEQDLQSLENSQLWVSRLNSVNDMFEGTIELDLDVLNLHFDFLKDKISQISVETQEEIIEKFYVGCFCENIESVPMWSYYADYHKGFCIEYAIEDFSPNPVFPVLYVENKKVNPYDFSIPTMQKSIMTKDMQWSGENEWRVLIPRIDNKERGIAIEQPKPRGIYMGVDSEENSNMERRLRKVCKEQSIPLYKMRVDKIKRKIYPQII